MKKIQEIFVFYYKCLTVRLLETSTSTASSKFLWLTSPWIRNKKVAIVVQKSLLQLVLRRFINILGVVGNNGLGNSSANGIDLGSCSSSLDAYTNIKVGEFFLSKDKDWLECLQTKRFRLDKLNGLAIDLDKSTSLLGESTSSGRLFPVKR